MFFMPGYSSLRPSLIFQTESDKSKYSSENYYYYYFVFLSFLGPALAAYGGSQARGLIRAVATGLHQSYNNARSEPHLRPIPQLMATPDP